MEEQQVNNLQDGNKTETTEEVKTLQDDTTAKYEEQIKNLTDEVNKLKASNAQLTKERDEANNAIASQEQKQEVEKIDDLMSNFLKGGENNDN